MRTRLPFLLLFCFTALAGCAAKSGQEPGVTVWENGSRRVIPAARFDEAAYLGRGFYRTVDAAGNPLYVLIPETDAPKDITFVAGSGTGKERSFGGLAGQFTGQRTATGALHP